MKKGFTLMEVLAVLLVIAVVASFAIPVVESVVEEMNYRKAQVAAAKLSEAVRTFYRESKGHKIGSGGINDSFLGMDAINFRGSCNSPALTGVPAFEASSGGDVGVEQLFLCEYLSAKDFAGLNYQFTVLQSSADGTLVQAEDQNPDTDARKETIRQK